jgi:hypothetical protein
MASPAETLRNATAASMAERFRKAVLSGIRKQETSVELEAIKQALNFW